MAQGTELGQCCSYSSQVRELRAGLSITFNMDFFVDWPSGKVRLKSAFGSVAVRTEGHRKESFLERCK